MTSIQAILLAGTVMLLAAMGCNSSPTVPVPPPQATLVSTTIPDANGIVTVSGAPTPNYGMEDIALIYNDNSGEGTMTDVRQNGSFQGRIGAQLYDVLYIQVKRESDVSDALVLTVNPPAQ